MLPLLFSFILSSLLINIECQQTLPLFRGQSTGASNNAQVVVQMQPNQQPQQSQQSQQSQQQQPQLLTLQQQQQLIQQLNALQQQANQQQQASQQQQQQQQQQQSQPQQTAAQQPQYVLAPQQQPQYAVNPQQQSPQQQFFDPNQQQQFFDPNQQPPQQFFQQNPQQFAPQPQPAQQQLQPQPQQPAAPGPQISWGKCPQLEPSDKEKVTKATVITKCLENTPLPANITRDTVEIHREQIAACALQSEGWFTPAGSYDFNKAENEIKNKKLTKQIEDQVLSYHKQCKVEAEEKFPSSKRNVIGQIQLYQACMDYFISDVCGIEVNEPEAPQFTGAQF